MLKSIEIRNFRAFSHLSVDGFNRINLFTGQNNVGKTCLLEALFLHLGAHNPDISVRLNVFRGQSPFGSDAERTWGWLFHRKRIKDGALIAFADDQSSHRELRIYLESGSTKMGVENGTAPVEHAKLMEPDSAPRSLRKLILSFTQDGQTYQAEAEHEGDGVRFHIAPVPAFPGSFFLSTRYRPEKELADQFGKVQELLHQEGVLEVLRIIEPRLKGLAIAPGGETLMADIDIGRLIPIAMLGEGFSRVGAMVLAILNTSKGCVLVDEIENGIHHSIHEKIWEALLQACRKEDVQLFATTHSRECALAAHRVFSKTLDFDYEFSAYRLERKKDPKDEGLIRAVPLTQATLDTADDLGWEVR